MKKVLLIVLIGLVMHVANAQNYSKKATYSLTINVNEGIELLSVIQYLGGRLENETPSPYKQALKKYFLYYKNHPAVKTIFLYDKKIYPDLTELGILFYDFPDIKMHPIADSLIWYKYWAKDTLLHYLRQCMQFYKDTKFHQFYVSHQTEYFGWGEALGRKMQVPVDIFSQLIAPDRSLYWSVWLDPLNDWGAHTIHPEKISASLKNWIMFQMGYFGNKDSSGKMLFNGEDVYNFAWHEGTHAISDTILSKYHAQIDSLAYMMKNEDALKRQNITDWQHYFNELIARSVSIALHKKYRDSADYAKLLDLETKRGFVNVRDVSDVIYDNFINEQKVDHFENVFPLIFDMLRSRYKG